MKAVGWVNGNGTIKWLGDKQPAPFTTMFVEVPKDAEDREPIGYSLEPIYAARPGSVVTQAFIMCTSCEDAISGTGGPRYNAVCLKCIAQLDLINKLKA
jgi:hypothetical protein